MSASAIRKTVIKQSINKAKRRISHLEKLIFADPLKEIIDVRKETGLAYESFLASESKTPQDYFDFASTLESLSKRDRKAWRLHRRQVDEGDEWHKEIGRLMFELQVLQSDLNLENIKLERGMV